MTHARKPGTLAARVTDVLHTLSPEAIKRAGTSMHQMRRFSNPMEAARIPLDVAAQLDGELIRAGHAPLFRQAFDELVAAQTGGTGSGHVTVQGLSQALLHLGGELGELQHRAQEAMVDGRLTKRERATLAHEAQDVIDGAAAIRDALEPPYADVADEGAANVEPMQRRAN